MKGFYFLHGINILLQFEFSPDYDPADKGRHHFFACASADKQGRAYPKNPIRAIQGRL
jgi:hypothetical protein